MTTTFRKIATLALAVSGLAAVASPASAKEKLTGEAKLAKLLEGRTAGKPTDCINLISARNSTVIAKTAIVYEDGRTLWVNRPTNADSLNGDDILVTRTSMSQLCRLDTVQLIDRTTQFWSGFVGLENFVPYRKTAR